MDTLILSSKYRTFVNERNLALERIESNAQMDISRILHEALETVTGFVSQMILTKTLSCENINPASSILDHFIKSKFESITPPLIARIKRLKRVSFYLAYLGELEAIARATKRTFQPDPSAFKRLQADQESSHNVSGKPVEAYVFQSLFKVRHKIVQAFISAICLDKKGDEILDDVKRAYPPIQAYKIIPRTLKRVREADDTHPKDKKEFDFYHDLTNDEDWDLAVQAYKDSELPPTRFDDEQSYNPKTGTMQYDWELEQDMTDEFVKQVRDGQVQAATDLGVQDFVWVAVIDKKTCEVCCMPRAGKLVSEIEEMLKSGELDKDECDATVPPAHPNCRCDIAPVASTEPVEGPNWKDFEDWLSS